MFTDCRVTDGISLIKRISIWGSIKKLDWLLIQFQWKIKSNWSMCPRLSGTCWIVRVFAVEWKFSCLRAGRLGKGDWEGARENFDNSELELGDHQQWQDQCYIRLGWNEWGCFGLYPCLFSFLMRSQWWSWRTQHGQQSLCEEFQQVPLNAAFKRPLMLMLWWWWW